MCGNLAGVSRGTIVQVSVSGGGVPKLPVPQARVGPLGLEGDVQRNKIHHGGPDRAVCLYAMERLQTLATEGHPIAPGTIGENLTIAGLDWAEVVVGARLRVGAEVRLEVTVFAPPCRTIRQSFKDGDFNRISDKRHPGWSRAYARVLIPGLVRAGDPVELLPSEG